MAMRLTPICKMSSGKTAARKPTVYGIQSLEKPVTKFEYPEGISP